MESASQKAVAVQYSTQDALKTDAKEDARIFSLRQKRELEPHRVEYSRTGAHGTKTWFLLPGKYFLSRQDISGNGKHRCYNAWLIVHENGEVTEERTNTVPEFVLFACSCLASPSPYL
jgi:hypothetical protein